MVFAKGETDIKLLHPSKVPLSESKMGIVKLTYRTLADGTLDVTAQESDLLFFARILKAVVKPTDPHTASWNLTINDENGVELIDIGTLSATATTTIRPDLIDSSIFPEFAELEFVISGAGDGKNGVIEVWFEW